MVDQIKELPWSEFGSKAKPIPYARATPTTSFGRRCAIAASMNQRIPPAFLGSRLAASARNRLRIGWTRNRRPRAH